MTDIITRFAPSPTGYLHIGNARTALINWLYARKNNGKFILRIDDTDIERSKEEYAQALIKDLKWLGLDWDNSFNQATRKAVYDKYKQILIEKGHLYPCFETTEELELKRKNLLRNNLPPIYDRAALKLSAEEIQTYLDTGKTPHYRFKLTSDKINWQDLVKGPLNFDAAKLSDPVVIRADGSMTYMLCSVIDDIEYNITHIIRGEDHVSNTAMQYQMFKALDATPPKFAHLSLITSKEDKISKRVGGFEISSLRDTEGLEPMAICSFLALIGTNQNLYPCKTLQELCNKFDLSNFSKSPTTYLPEELSRLNQKLLVSLDYVDVQEQLQAMGLGQINANFWQIVKGNISKLYEIKDWWKIYKNPDLVSELDKVFLEQAANLLPSGDFTEKTWDIWITTLKHSTDKKGKELFMPLRLALTGMEHGPELKYFLPLLKREEIIKRLKNCL